MLAAGGEVFDIGMEGFTGASWFSDICVVKWSPSD